VVYQDCGPEVLLAVGSQYAYYFSTVIAFFDNVIIGSYDGTATYDPTILSAIDEYNEEEELNDFHNYGGILVPNCNKNI